MAWESRKRNAYYYRKERRGPQVYSIYVGNSPAAHLQADTDAHEQHKRESAWAAERELRRTERRLTHLVDGLAGDVGNLLTAHLLLAGYHTHRRQWRIHQVPEGSAPVE